MLFEGGVVSSRREGFSQGKGTVVDGLQARCGSG